MRVRLKYKWFSSDDKILDNYYERLRSVMNNGGIGADPGADQELQTLRKILQKKGLISEGGSVEEDIKNMTAKGGRSSSFGSKNFDEFLDFMNEGKGNLSNGRIKDSSNWFKKKWYYGFGKNEEELRNLLLNEYLIDTSKNVDSTTKSLSTLLGFSKGKRGREFNDWVLKNGKKELDLKDIGGLNAIDKLPTDGLGFKSTVLDSVINNPEFDKLSKETQEKFLDYAKKRSKLLRNRNLGRIGMATTAIGAGTGLLYGGYKAATNSRFLNHKLNTPTSKTAKTTKTFSSTDGKMVGPIRRSIINSAADSAIKEKKDDSDVKKQGHLAATLSGLGIGSLEFAGAKFGSNWIADRLAADGYQTAALARDEGKVHDYMGNMPGFEDEKQKFKDRAREFKKQSFIDIFGTNKKITDKERELIKDIADSRHKKVTKAGTILGTGLLALSTLASNLEAHKILSRKLKSRNKKLKKNNIEDEDTED